MEGQTLNLFRYWFERGINEGAWNDGTKFFYFYLCFNIAAASLSGKDTDRDMIESIKLEPNGIQHAFNRRLEYPPFREALSALQRECPITNIRSEREYPISEIENIAEVIEVIYQVRCNFFHGGKMMNDSRDSRIVQASSLILKYWMEVIFTRGVAA